jgi:AcrR family transcriptional regulator
MDIKDKILKGASDLFHRYGIRSVSMDDLARSLSVSKKTIYQYFTDKDEIVALATRLHTSEMKEEYDSSFERAKDPVDELTKMSHCMRKHFKDLNPSLLYDIQKFYPSAWEEFNRFKMDYIRNRIESNLRRGIELGYYRAEINVEVLSLLRLEEVQMAFDPTRFPLDKFDFRETQMQMLDHFIHGIVTQEGKALFDKYNEEQQQANN